MLYRKRKKVAEEPSNSAVLSVDKGVRKAFLKSLIRTDDARLIEDSVHSSDPEVVQSVSLNPRLTEAQCRFLLPRLDGSEVQRALFVEGANFPSDLLLKLATSDPSGVIRGVVATHPNATVEAKAIAALRGTVDFGDALFSSVKRK